MSSQAFVELAEHVERLETRLAALEQHIVTYGPKVVKHDYDTPGTSTWSEPYKPPETSP